MPMALTKNRSHALLTVILVRTQNSHFCGEWVVYAEMLTHILSYHLYVYHCILLPHYILSYCIQHSLPIHLVRITRTKPMVYPYDTPDFLTTLRIQFTTTISLPHHSVIPHHMSRTLYTLRTCIFLIVRTYVFIPT